MDIILHCLDPGHLKAKPLNEVFPAVCRFNQVGFMRKISNSRKRVSWFPSNEIAKQYQVLKIVKNKQENCDQFQVSHCSTTRRIAVGSKTGQLALYELRGNIKSSTLYAHQAPVTACAFSPEGKFLVSYSCSENKLCFWQVREYCISHILSSFNPWDFFWAKWVDKKLYVLLKITHSFYTTLSYKALHYVSLKI